MSSRDWFWFLAGVLVTVAVMVTLRAWTRERPAQTVRSAIPTFAVPIAAALGLIGVALGIYFLLGSPDSIASAQGKSVTPDSTMPTAGTNPSSQVGQSSTTNAGALDDVTQKLANRLATKGGSDSEWQLLAESYDYMGRTADAKAARAHKAFAAPQGTAGAGGNGGSGSDGAGSDAGPGAGFDGQTMAAVADALDNGPGRRTASAGGMSDVGGASAGDAPAGKASAASEAPSGSPQISGTVELAPKFASRVPAGATLFIYAKQPNAPGPPLAVVRLRADHWPITFTLSDANAMVPGRNLSNSQTVQIEARISRRGEALPQTGDLVGSVTSVNPRAARPVKISIDREIG